MINKIKQFFSNHDILILAIVASCFSIASFLYYYDAGLITAYGDSRAHLNIARRVIDSLTPGVAQLGGYWPPLLHALMLPTIWNDFMWQSGLSGSIPSMIAFVLTVVFIYKLSFSITSNKFAGIIAALIVMLNPNLLYIQATPMTESLFIATLTMFMYFFYQYFKEKKISDLIIAALFLVLCSLNRYEGWGLVIASNVLLLWYWAQSRFSKKIEGIFIIFATLSFLGIFLWLVWGAVIFNDPLEFMHNDLSAGTNTKALEQDYDWTGYGNLYEAIITNVFSIIHTSSLALSILALLGISVFIFKKFKFFLKGKFLFLLLFFIPLIFDIITVYFGKVPVEIPEISNVPYPMNSFNIRYGLYSLPMIAFFIASISRKKFFQFIVIFIVIFSYAFLFFNHNNGKEIIVLKGGGARSESREIISSIDWFKQNYDGGLILASTGGQEDRIFLTGIEQKKFITENAYKYWDQSLENPSKYATWIMISDNNPRDMLFKKINKKILYEDFQVKNENIHFMIMKKIEKN